MEDLINRIVTNLGIDQELAGKAVGIMLNFLNSDGPEDKVGEIFENMPGARELMESANEDGGGGGLLGALGNLGGGLGAMGTLNKLTSAGLDMDQVQGITKEVISFAKEKVDEETVDEVVNSIPGLNQIL